MKKPKEKPLKIYIVNLDDEFHVLGIAAETAREARKIAYEDDGCEGMSWIKISPILNKNIDTAGLEKGVIPAIEGLKRNLFSCIEEDICPICGRLRTIFMSEDGSISCAECVMKEEV